MEETRKSDEWWKERMKHSVQKGSLNEKDDYGVKTTKFRSVGPKLVPNVSFPSVRYYMWYCILIEESAWEQWEIQH